MATKRLSDEALRVLGSMTIDGNRAAITAGQLARPLYVEVNKALDAIGGRWNRKAGAHVFEEDPRDALDRIVLTGGFSNRKQDFGFFETPEALADELVALAGIEHGHRVLEPNAGCGRIVKAIMKAAAKLIPFAPIGPDINPPIDLVLCELMPENRAALEAAGFGPFLSSVPDFLQAAPDFKFDRAVMNPPFARQADHDHVLHAYKLLGRGGRLVSVMGAGVTFCETAKSRRLRELAEETGSIRELPPGTFRESGTDANAVVVVLNKAA